MLSQKCAATMEKTKGYCSWVQLGNPSENGNMEWHLHFQKPDRFNVMQIAGEDQDLWLTVEEETYRYLGFWVQMANERGNTSRINQFLLADKFLEVLRTAQPQPTRTYHFPDQRPWIVTLGGLEFGFPAQNLTGWDMTLIEFDVETIGEDDILND